jgi:type IV secretory pathway protease TraF
LALKVDGVTAKEELLRLTGEAIEVAAVDQDGRSTPGFLVARDIAHKLLLLDMAQQQTKKIENAHTKKPEESESLKEVDH